jgi:signal transduction histidine kinase
MSIHDLRTPLNGMLLSVQALEMMGDLDETQREMVGMTRTGGETLIGMINDLLDVSKMESGTMQLERRKAMAANLIEAAMKQVTPIANARYLALATELQPNLPSIMVDEAKLVRTLVNLLSNAIKFTPERGTVTVGAHVSQDGSTLRFSVRDTGEGIPPEAFGLIFQKFGQVESRQGGRLMSTGLGLAFCALAAGSTFSFTIPIRLARVHH